MTTCHTCHAELKDFTELALHISTTKGHRKGKKWAANFLMKVQERPEIKKIPVNPDYVPTEYGNENRRNAVRELCGEQEYANTQCPDCKRSGIRLLVPAEYLNGRSSWRNTSGELMVLCNDCRNRYKTNREASIFSLK